MKNKMSRLFMAVMMAALVVGAFIVNVSAADCTHTGANEVTSTTAELTEGTWYLGGDVNSTVASSITVSGNVTLCLCDHILTAPNAILESFITVPNGNSLTICGGTNGGGKIVGAGSTYATRGILVNGTLTLNSGTITGFGITKSGTGRGGGVSVSSGTFYMNGGAITGNTAEDRAGGVYVASTDASMTMTDGTISNNTANKGSAIYATTSGTQLIISGGNISGEIYLNNVRPVISGGKFTWNPGNYVATGYTCEETGDAVYPYEVIKSENKTLIESTTTTWADGTYYLNADTMVNGPITVTGSVILELNGYKLQAPASCDEASFITVEANSLTIQDSSEGKTGGIVGNDADTDTRGIAVTGGELTLTGGTISGFTSTQGGGVRLASGAVMNMEGGTISGNTATDSTKSGGGVYITTSSSKLNLSGGSITGNITGGTSGGGVWINGGTLNMTGGTIAENQTTGGEASGAILLQKDTHTISGGFIGGSLNVVSGTLTISSGTFTVKPDSAYIADGYEAYESGDNWVVQVKVPVGPVELTDIAALAAGGEFCLGENGLTANAKVSISKDTILDLKGKTLTAPSTTGSFITVTDGATLTINDSMSGGKIVGGTSGLRGILVNSGGALVLNGGTISGFQYKTGAGVRVNGGTFTMNGGAIDSENKAIESGDGAGIYCNGGTYLIVGDAEVAQQIYIQSAQTIFTIQGGTFSSTSTNGLYNVGGGAVTITGGTFNKRVRANAGTITIEGGQFADVYASGTGEITISGGKFSAKNDVNDLAAWAKDNIAEIWDGSDYVYSYNENGFYSSGEHMNFGSSLALGLYLNKEIGNGCTVTASPYTAGATENIIWAKGIAAKDMDKDITYTIKNGDTTLFQKTVSIYDAAKVWQKDADKTIMVQDMINYGIAAQDAFSTVTMSTLGEGTPGELTWEAANADVNEWEDGEVAVSLNLKERIELNFYLKGEGITEDSITATGATKENLGNNIIRVTFADIDVKDVKNPVILTVDGKTIKYSIVDYVVANTNQVDLMTALAKYVDAVSQ